MNSLKKILITLIILMALAINLYATPIEDDDQYVVIPTSGSLRGASRFLAQHSTTGLMKCNKNPRLCRAKGSPGPDCCKKTCVNVMTDKQNCGMCGKKCKRQEICCKGKCVNPMMDKRHCGGCNNRCKRGNSCTYGMCSYA
ncbi:hypothetical protein L6452_35276 [Arctium lappa]|uniref:Uncharacterized protein n=1 Tax=Arctium lappa TaxID=4217 RepID=A0ACB8Y609_ARCLA|nr:hypothetical protein L6452_35276 [Arctium lappa]